MSCSLSTIPCLLSVYMGIAKKQQKKKKGIRSMIYASKNQMTNKKFKNKVNQKRYNKKTFNNIIQLRITDIYVYEYIH